MEASYDVAREVIEVDELEEGNISTAAGKQDWLSWAVPHSGLKLKNENWKTKIEKQKLKNKKWKTKNGKRKMENEKRIMKNKKWKTKHEKWKTKMKAKN